MGVLSSLEPKGVFQFFEEICQIPHGTFNTKEISDYCVAFAKKRGLSVYQDEVNNVIIRKPGTAGYENSEPVIIQGHMDMVCEKKPDSDHDFMKDPLELYVEDGFIKAKDTTLGGDDGIAIAMALALLDSDTIPHPPIEALFTVDEEIGMGGAHAIDLSLLKGRKLINIDSEEEGVLTTGCAGGVRIRAALPVHRENATGTVMEVKIKGLQGGHSGAEIHKQRGNAHKMMGRLLKEIASEVAFRLISVGGGSADNVIAMEDTARLLLDAKDADRVAKIAAQLKSVFDSEFMGDEPGLEILCSNDGQQTASVLCKEDTRKVIDYLVVVINGIQAYSRKLEGLVQTSLNMGRVETEEENVIFYHLIRSSVNSEKAEVRSRVEQLAAMIGAEVECDSEYPAWEYDPKSELRQIMEEEYKNLYGEEPKVIAIHAGLECGLFLGKRDDLDCVSIGPNMWDIHSFSERLDIQSTARTWDYLKAVLAKLK